MVPGSPAYRRPARLADAGVDVTVLEARERVGGRVWSVTLTNGAVVEMGAEWIMAGDTRVREVAQRFDVPLVETGASYGRREPWGPGAASLEAQDRFLEQANDAIAALPPGRVASMSVGGVPGLARRRRGCAVDRDGCGWRARAPWICMRSRSPSFGGERPFSPHVDPYLRVGIGQPGDRPSSSRRRCPTCGLVTRSTRSSTTTRGVTARVGPHAERADAVVVAVPSPIAARLTFLPALARRSRVGARGAAPGRGVEVRGRDESNTLPRGRARRPTLDVVLDGERRGRQDPSLRRVVRRVRAPHRRRSA